ncbi:rRNA maturation RNase YbeY [Caenispirillum bisanense]|uniref:Endoribonuclease YbeY n=1 Tax=Caenispirillum bisanense TaxID=414052 RepID=A0A286GVU2_9PROT|nr:rRNA maturation RNase YbeY [Caenispirillum bisanense]SOD99199.1 probable rRNA maturation factor [Caenispirillum bisanense]
MADRDSEDFDPTDAADFDVDGILAAPAVDVLVEAPRWAELLPDAEALVVRAAHAAYAAGAPDAFEPEPPDLTELTVVLHDDSAVRALNKQYRRKDQPTNVLSFAALEGDMPPLPEDEPVPLGDVVLALETCEREAQAAGIPFEHHVFHLVVHGVLHLLGYDHEDDGDADEMEAMETAVLAAAGIPDPYAAAGDNEEESVPPAPESER